MRTPATKEFPPWALVKWFWFCPEDWDSLLNSTFPRNLLTLPDFTVRLSSGTQQLTPPGPKRTSTTHVFLNGSIVPYRRVVSPAFRVLSPLDRLETDCSETGGRFSFRSLSLDICEHINRTPVQSKTAARRLEWKRCSRLRSVRTLEPFVRSENTTEPAAGANSLDAFCPVTGAKRFLLKWTIRFRTFMYSSLPTAPHRRAFSPSLVLSQFHKHRCFVLGVQHLGNVFCPDGDEAFHLLAAPS